MRTAAPQCPDAAASPTIGDRLAKAPLLWGRERELALLARLAEPEGPIVAHLHGPPGIGKSALLANVAERWPGRVLRLGGRSLEPRPAAILNALARAAGAEDADTLAAVAGAVGAADAALVVLDDADGLRLAETWLRQVLLPALPAETRLVMAGAAPPSLGWTTEYGRHFLAVPLGPLSAAAVRAAAAAEALSATDAERIWALSAGHPLALAMALQMARAGQLERAGSASQLTDAVVAAAGLPELADLVEAASVVRRATRPILAAMLGEDGLASYPALLALPFVAADAEGPYLAEPVRRALAERLTARRPDRAGALRQAAVEWTLRQLGAAGPRERWRLLADLMHFVEQPLVRDAFFPPAKAAPSVDPARPEEHAAIAALAAARAGEIEATILGRWLGALPHRVHVARDERGDVAGVHLHAREDDPLAALAAADPVLARWQRHLANEPPATGAAVFVRRVLAADPAPEAAAKAACFLDLKRIYFEHGRLARIYAAVDAPDLADPMLRSLGFRPLSEPGCGLPGSLVLDLPEGSLTGWIARLVGAETLPAREEAFEFDRSAREIRLSGKVERLTALEAGVLAALIDRTPAAVARDDLIETVWRRAHVGSNVVDALVRTLRRKLGSRRAMIETVPKLGYRFRPDGR
jgi:hypothetical protein